MKIGIVAPGIWNSVLSILRGPWRWLWADATTAELAAPPGPEQLAGLVRDLAELLDCGRVTTELAAFLATAGRGEIGG